ncbi:MAG: carbohydrate-binding protein [Bacteroidales bacterium]|nr:carbohydrate-binding protein [Bacteroidales bacterium]
MEAEDFVINSGTKTENTSDTGGGLNVGYIDTGDWLEYLVKVSEAGSYKITFRIAAPNTAGTIEVLAPGMAIEKLGSVNLPITNGWQTWVNVTMNIQLTTGQQRLRLYVVKGAFNLNWIKFERNLNTGIIDPENEVQTTVYPNPARNFVNFESRDKILDIKLYDTNGRCLIHDSSMPGYFKKLDINLSKGIYFIEIITEKGKSTKKITIE